MLAGKLNRRITILESSETRDANDRPSTTWTPLALVWASIDIQSSALLYEPSVYASKVLYRITTRWHTSLTLSAANRLQYTEARTGIVHTYTIESVQNTQAANRELVILAHELDGSE